VIISHHAYERAEERLGMDSFTFRDWVKTTRGEWVELDIEYFQALGVRINGTGHFYRGPLNATRALCLVVEGITIVTVIPFDREEPPSPNVTVIPFEREEPPSPNTRTKVLKVAKAVRDVGAVDHNDRYGARALSQVEAVAVLLALSFFAISLLAVSLLLAELKRIDREDS
jgi:hypothetical protein